MIIPKISRSIQLEKLLPEDPTVPEMAFLSNHSKMGLGYPIFLLILRSIDKLTECID